MKVRVSRHVSTALGALVLTTLAYYSAVGATVRAANGAAPTGTALLLALAVVSGALAALAAVRLRSRRARTPAPEAVAQGGVHRGVRPLRRVDLPSAARLHAQELPEGFLARLGPLFLRRYLSTFSTVPGGVALAVDGADGQFAGFVVGSTTAGYNRRALRRRWRSLLPAALLALLTRPALAVHFVRTRAGRYARVLSDGGARPAAAEGHDRSDAGVRPDSVAVLLHVAVRPGARGQGLGRTLVEAFVVAARDNGCGRARLVSFGDTDGFYAVLGWDQLASRVDADGRQVITYGREL